MLSIFILVGIAKIFAQLAHDKNRNSYLWGAIGVASFYLTQVIIGVIMAIVNPELLEDNLTTSAVGVICGFLGVFVTYYVLKSQRDTTKEIVLNPDLLDSNLD